MRLVLEVLAYVWNYPPNRGQRLRRVALALFWQLHKRLVGLPIVYRLDNGYRFIAYPESTGASFPFYASEYDYPYIRFHRTWLSGNGAVIDVGANIGLYALSLASHCKAEILLEPDPVAFRMLSENLALNGLQLRSLLFQVAAGAVEGDVYLAQSDTAGLTNHVASSGDIVVRQLTVDSIMASMDTQRIPDVEFVKIDVEGYELEVLRGMVSLLDGPVPPKLVQFERLERTPIQPLLDFFRARRWTVFAVGDDCMPTTDAAAIQSAHDLMATSRPLAEFGARSRPSA
jgi:FkbM family methyltransferase